MTSRQLFACLLFSNLTTIAYAQDSIVDPESVVIPAMRYGDDPKIQKNGDKFFFFHNPNISYEEAYTDFLECRMHLPSSSLLMLPNFVPWGQVSYRKNPQNTPSPYGIVGAVMGSILFSDSDIIFRNRKMRMCMDRRGYDRYAIDKDSYMKINEGEERNIIALQAKIATSPPPKAQKVMK